MEPQKIQDNSGSQLIQFEKTDSYSKIFVYFIQDFLNWWYVKMPIRHLRILGRISVFVDDNLSMSLLFKNFFIHNFPPNVSNSYMVNMNGPSYRMKETKEWIKKESLKVE